MKHFEGFILQIPKHRYYDSSLDSLGKYPNADYKLPVEYYFVIDRGIFNKNLWFRMKKRNENFAGRLSFIYLQIIGRINLYALDKYSSFTIFTSTDDHGLSVIPVSFNAYFHHFFHYRKIIHLRDFTISGEITRFFLPPLF